MKTMPSDDDEARKYVKEYLEAHRLDLDRMKHCQMANWYSPRDLSQAGTDFFLSALLKGRQDYRMLEALAEEQPLFDYSAHQIDGTSGIWIDYVADLADGFNPTYAIATLLARPQLTVGPHTTRRGDVLIMGGDEVYPSATREDYQNRLVEPYEAASIPPPDMERPHLFAIPGNHDWYDGLISFMRLFAQKRTLGLWQTRQSRSYFALKLPHNWWLLGVDIQLDSDIDRPQIDYFTTIAREQMKPGDRIILCTAEPDWVLGKVYDPRMQHNLAFLEKELLKHQPAAQVIVRLAGDLHHYRHHVADGDRHNIISGGGGAFLHPTHGLNVDTVRSGPEGDMSVYTLKSSFPSIATSRRLAWRNLGFLRLNFDFGLITAIAYSLLSLTFITPTPGTLVGALVLLRLIVFFTDTHHRLYKIIGGTFHGLSHLTAAFAVTRLLCLWRGITFFNDALPPSTAEQLLIMFLAGLAGWVIGPIIMGVYLLVSLNVFGRHGNEAFSSLRIQDYKNFLRMHFHDGGLTIYPMGLRKVPREWAQGSPIRPGEALFKPVDRQLEPELIEAEPIHIPAARAP